MNKPCLLSILTLTGMATLFPTQAMAQVRTDSFPSKPLTIIVPSTAGSASDNDARFWAPALSDSLKQTVLFDYKPGAGGVIGTHFVAKAPPDGHTILMMTGTFTTLAASRDDLPYDPMKDFSAISLVSRRGTLLVATPSFAAQTFAEYIAYAKSNPGKVNYGTNGVGTIYHMVGAWLGNVTGTEVSFIQYKSNAQMYVDLVAGRVHVSPMTSFSAQSFLKSGKVRALAQLSQQRSPFHLDLPTVSEQGVSGFDYSSWQGFVAPAKTPANIISRLNGAFAAWSRAPEAIKMAARDGTELVGSSPQFLEQTIAREIPRWKKIIRENNIKPEE